MKNLIIRENDKIILALKKLKKNGKKCLVVWIEKIFYLELCLMVILEKDFIYRRY